MSFYVLPKSQLIASMDTSDQRVAYVSQRFRKNVTEARLVQIQQQLYRTRVKALQWQIMGINNETQLPMSLDIGFLTADDKTQLFSELQNKGYTIEDPQASPMTATVESVSELPQESILNTSAPVEQVEQVEPVEQVEQIEQVEPLELTSDNHVSSGSTQTQVNVLAMLCQDHHKITITAQ